MHFKGPEAQGCFENIGTLSWVLLPPFSFFPGEKVQRTCRGSAAAEGRRGWVWSGWHRPAWLGRRLGSHKQLDYLLLTSPPPQPVGFSPEVTNTLFWLKLVSQEASNQLPGASGKDSGWAVEDTCLSQDSSLCEPQLLLFVLRKVPLARSGCLAQPLVVPGTGAGVLCCPLLSGRLHHRLPQV